jgi:hypothetical protein
MNQFATHAPTRHMEVKAEPVEVTGDNTANLRWTTTWQGEVLGVPLPPVSYRVEAQVTTTGGEDPQVLHWDETKWDVKGAAGAALRLLPGAQQASNALLRRVFDKAR